MDCRTFTKYQFHYSKLFLSHGDWRLFVYTPWLPRNSSQLIYITYRWAICLYFLGWLGYAGYQANINHGAKYLIFVTAWEFIFLNLYLIMSSIIVTYKYIQETVIKCRTPEPLHSTDLHDPPFLKCYCCCKKFSIPNNRFQQSLPWYIQLNWVLYTITSHLAIPVVVFYWAVGLNIANWQVTTHEHLLILVPILIDMLLTSYPIRFYHFIYTSLFAMVYSIFTVIYYAAGGTHSNGSNFIYPSLDYENAVGAAIVWIVLLCTLVPVLMNSLFWGLYLLRTLVIFKKVSAIEAATRSEPLTTRENSVSSSLGLVKSPTNIVSTATLVIPPIDNDSEV